MTTDLIDKINKKYNYRYKILENMDRIMIDDGVDEWMIDRYPDSDKKLILFHKNKKPPKKGYHPQWYEYQDNYKNYKKLFEQIRSHYDMKYRGK
jgi:hypothetical protein